MYGLEITFKSGAQVFVDLDEFTSTRNRWEGGRLSGLEWTTPADWSRKLHWLDLSEVACLVVVRDGQPFPGAADVVKETLTTDPGDGDRSTTDKARS